MKYIILFLLLSFSIFSQQVDFYDIYDYDMRNYRGGENMGEESYKEYQLPPQFQKPALVNPKNVRRQSDMNSLMQSRTGIRRNAQGTQNQIQNANNLPINPITGEINPEAIIKQREKDRIKKEKRREFQNREIEPYTETRARRMEIIFLTTLPFAIPLSVGITILAGMASGNPGILQTTPGFIFTALFSVGFSTANMLLDINRYDEYMKNKKEVSMYLPQTDRHTSTNLNLNVFEFSFSIGTKQF